MLCPASRTWKISQAPRRLPRPRQALLHLCTPLATSVPAPGAASCLRVCRSWAGRVLGSPLPGCLLVAVPTERSGRGCGAGTHAPQVPRRRLESERGHHAWDGDVRVSPASALGAQRPHRTFWCPLADGLALSDSRGALEKCSLWSPRALRSSSRTAEVNFLTRHSVVTTAKSKL